MTTMKKKDEHLSGLEIECEKCGGLAKIVNASYPNSYECICKKCGHKFVWTESKIEH